MSKSFYDWNVQKFTWHTNKNGLYIIDNDFNVTFRDDLHRKYAFTILKGAKTDGGSIPKFFSWFADSWRDDDYRYNATFIMHDALYASELFPKDVADDLLRSSLRDCGETRMTASTICWCVNTFAKRHYGKKHDKYYLRKYIVRTL